MNAFDFRLYVYRLTFDRSWLGSSKTNVKAQGHSLGEGIDEGIDLKPMTFGASLPVLSTLRNEQPSPTCFKIKDVRFAFEASDVSRSCIDISIFR